MKNRKQYFAFIPEDLIDYFESKSYIILADEGSIDPKYELRTGEGI